MAGCVLTVDIGNTTTRLGVFAGGAAAGGRAGRAGARGGAGSGADAADAAELAGTWELTTPARITADEAFSQVKQALSMMGTESVEGAIMACVVPSLSSAWAQALSRVCASRPLVVGPGLKTGMRMRYDDPSEVGADRIADVVAARASYGAPVVVVDLGTTTNFEVVDADGSFAGGIIAPGMGLGASALAERAAKLPMVELRAPASVVGKSTEAAMRSGLVLGEVARIEGLLGMIARELGVSGPAELPVVLTGDSAQGMAALLSVPVQVDDTLTLRGLHVLYRHNRR